MASGLALVQYILFRVQTVKGSAVCESKNKISTTSSRWTRGQRERWQAAGAMVAITIGEPPSVMATAMTVAQGKTQGPSDDNNVFAMCALESGSTTPNVPRTAPRGSAIVLRATTGPQQDLSTRKYRSMLPFVQAAFFAHLTQKLKKASALIRTYWTSYLPQKCLQEMQ
jgi:hypothetical protein